jgi:type VI secretion system protein ImpF
MAELIPRENLQPSLLDRLTDDEPDQQSESREKRVLSMDRLRAGVLRDLQWLLNTCNLEAIEPLDDHPIIAGSVLNYGIPDLTGLTSSTIDLPALERVLKLAIQEFEPRISPKSLKVRVHHRQEAMDHNALAFEIEGELWANPLPMHLALRTEVDLESGEFKVSEDRD